VANPNFKTSHSVLHKLGIELLKLLLKNALKETQIPEILSVNVELQCNRIDLLVKINDAGPSPGLVVIIEDKVDTEEHSDQVSRYMKYAREIYPDENTKIVAVLLKTGNASSIGASAANEEFGFFSRTDLLEVLKKHSDTNNAIIDDFFEHLMCIENLTKRFSAISVDQWTEQDPKIYEGVYNALEDKMQGDDWWKERGSWGWRYVNNPRGGFYCMPLAGFKVEFDGQITWVYLQIEGAARLTLRIGRWEEGQAKVDSSLMHKCLDKIQQCLDGSESAGFTASKAGAFRGGQSGAVASFGFGDQQASFVAQNDNGCVNMEKTIENLKKAVKFTETFTNRLLH